MRIPGIIINCSKDSFISRIISVKTKKLGKKLQPKKHMDYVLFRDFFF